MKTLLSLILFFVGTFSIAQQKGQVAFTITEKDIIPEGIAYDPAEKAFYLSSIFKSKIIKITNGGVVSDFVRTNQDSILQVLGMKVDGKNRLWACNNTAEHDTVNRTANIHIYNLTTGQLIKRLSLRDGKKHLFNDLVITSAGDAYITDSEAGSIYNVGNDGVLVEFIKAGVFRYPNGITTSADEKTLIVSSAGLGFLSVDISTKEVKPITHPKFFIIGTDGLYRYENTLIGVQNVTYPEGIIKLTMDATGLAFNNIEYLISNHPLFDTPTTGVIVGNEFFFIANSQLLQIIGNNGKIKNAGQLRDTVIMKIKLN
jgi:hypothetical protein